MTRRSRVRRTMLICTHFLRNLAFYRAGHYRGSRKKRSEYWIVITNNCLDHCVLEWCKLFAERKGKHRWQKIIDDQTSFSAQILTATRMSQAEFDGYVDAMLKYRDKFVAHLDELGTMDIPALRPAQRAVHALYTHILHNEGGFFSRRTSWGTGFLFETFSTRSPRG